MFHSGQRLACLRKLWIDRERTLVPGSRFSFQASALTGGRDSKRRISVDVKDVRFECVRANRARRRSTTTTEHLFVLIEQRIQRHVLRFWHHRDQQALLVRPKIQVKAVIIPNRASDCDRAARIGLHENLYVVALRIVAIKRDAKAGISFSQLTDVPVAEKKWNHDKSDLVADLLDLLKIHEWKSETIAIDEKNRTWACRVKDILSKATGDEILALIDWSIICRHHNRDGDETNCGDDALSLQCRRGGRSRNEVGER